MEAGTIQQATTVAAGGIAVSLGQVGQILGGVQVGQISNYRVVGESQFYELGPEEREEERSEDPPRAEELTLLLAEHRLLIFAGDLEDKAECARRIARRLYAKLTAEGRHVSIRQRCRGKDPQRIETAFSEEGTTILLLTEISKSVIAGYGPVEMRQLLVEKGGYAILTTDCDRVQWGIADGTVEESLWQDLSWQTYHGRERLTGYLEHLIFDTDAPIPEGLVREGPDGVQTLGDVPFAEAAAKLKSPERILTFFKSLVRGDAPSTQEGVRTKLAELAGDAAGIRQWYLQFDDRDQLLVVGLVLLDGLPDDLLFAGLEILVETTWRGTDPLFCQFDYRDLSRFAAYFKQTPVGGGFLRIETGSRQHRIDILQVAWNHQRRRLLATLPALTAMIRASAAADPAVQLSLERGAEESPQGAAEEGEASISRQSAERALSRTKSGSSQLHQVVVESLSLIGLLSVEVVEPYLLDLATDPSESVQILVAQALAGWRDAGKEQEFFSLLRRWWLAACDVGNFDSAIGRAAKPGLDPWTAVRATLAIMVGYAAPYDPEDHLAPELQALLEVLVDDPHPRVRGAVLRHGLPRTIAWHLVQLESFLCQRLLGSSEFVWAVASGAAAACEMRPQIGLPIVEQWWATARADRQHGNLSVPARRELLLAAVATTYGYIRSSKEQFRMSAQVLLGNLCFILNEESHPFVRRHALLAVEVQTQADLDLADRVLPDLLTWACLDDRPQLIALAVRSYLHQRQQMEGADQKIELDGRRFAIWTEGTRPLTAIEATLYGWLFDPSRPVAQQLAVEMFEAFAATVLEREERRLRGARPLNATTGGSSGGPVGARPEVHPLNVLGHLAVIAATLHRQELRPLLRPLVAEAIAERQRQQPLGAERLHQSGRSTQANPPAMAHLDKVVPGEGETAGSEPIGLLLSRWDGVTNASARALAGHLRRALEFYRWRWGMVTVLVLLLFGFYLLYRRADAAVQEPLALLAECVVPVPVAIEDLMAPLPPGRLAEQWLRAPYILEFHGERLQNHTLAGEKFPKPFVLGEFAAPLPPGALGGLSMQRYQSKTEPKAQVLTTPQERASAWKRKIW